MKEMKVLDISTLLNKQQLVRITRTYLSSYCEDAQKSEDEGRDFFCDRRESEDGCKGCDCIKEELEEFTLYKGTAEKIPISLAYERIKEIETEEATKDFGTYFKRKGRVIVLRINKGETET